jgi:hypothetical protein
VQTENEKITYTFDELKDVLGELELILQSLHTMGAYYGDKFSTYSEEIYYREYEKETTRFIDEWHICSRLAKMRSILSEKFNETLGEDNMSDLERSMEKVKHWNKPGDMP